MWRLTRAGWPVVVTELPRPLTVRRTVALSTAVLDGRAEVEGMEARLVADADEAVRLAATGVVPVLVSPDLPVPSDHRGPDVIVDARLAKRNIDTDRGQAPLVIGLGPGFEAGVDCDAVVETNRGHHLGRVLWSGGAEPDTGTPGRVEGRGRERVLRAPAAGRASWRVAIGDRVATDDLLGTIGAAEVRAPFPGRVRGLIAEEVDVTPGLKVGDVDPRDDRDACFQIGDKALAVGGGVVEAVLTHWSGSAVG